MNTIQIFFKLLPYFNLVLIVVSFSMLQRSKKMRHGVLLASIKLLTIQTNIMKEFLRECEFAFKLNIGEIKKPIDVRAITEINTEFLEESKDIIDKLGSTRPRIVKEVDSVINKIRSNLISASYMCKLYNNNKIDNGCKTTMANIEDFPVVTRAIIVKNSEGKTILADPIIREDGIYFPELNKDGKMKWVKYEKLRYVPTNTKN